MKIFSLFGFIFELLLLSLCCSHAFGHSKETSKVLLLSFDGFRYDYFDLAEKFGVDLVNFKKIFQTGIKADYLETLFLTRTFPNHISIITGCFEETHGIIDNSFYDPLYNETFSNRNIIQSLESKWFNVSEPIWVTNLNNGHQSAVIYWPGQLARFRNKYFPTFSFGVYNSFVSLDFKIDLILKWLSHEDTTLGIIYHFEPDSTAHKSGVHTDDILKKLQELDRSVGYLLKQIESTKLKSQLNIIIVSDHGISSISDERKIFMDYYVDPALYNQYHEESYSFWGLWPKQNVSIDLKTLKSIQHATVYLKEDIPKDWHYSASRRVAPIVVLADEGWALVHNSSEKIVDNAAHGYSASVKNMRGIFLAWGPDILAQNRSGIVRVVDVFPLIAELLHLKNIPPINGSLANVNWMLKHISSDAAMLASFLIICGLALVSVLIACIIVSCAHYNSNALRVQKIGNTYVLKSGNLVRRWQQRSEGSTEDKNVNSTKFKKYMNMKTKITEADAAFLLESNDEDEILGDIPSSNYKFSS